MTLCPACSHVIADPAAVACPACGTSQGRPAPSPAPVFPGLVRPKLPLSVDLAITVDRTASSLQFQDGIPVVMESVLRGIEPLVTGMRVFLYTHGDLDEKQDTVLMTDGGSPDQALADLKQIRYEGGGDPKESHLDAIEHVAEGILRNATPGASRTALLAIMTADSKPCRSGRSASELGEWIRKQGIRLYTVCEPTPTLYQLVKSAGGLMFAISVTPNRSDFQIIAAQLTASITQPAPGGKTIPMRTQ